MKGQIAATASAGGPSGKAALQSSLMTRSFISKSSEFDAVLPALYWHFDQLKQPIPAVSLDNEQPLRCVLLFASTIASFKTNRKFLLFKQTFFDAKGKSATEQTLQVSHCRACSALPDVRSERCRYYCRDTVQSYCEKQAAADFKADMHMYSKLDFLFFNTPLEMRLFNDVRTRFLFLKASDVYKITKLYDYLRVLAQRHETQSPERFLGHCRDCVLFVGRAPALFSIYLEEHTAGLLRFQLVNQKLMQKSKAIVNYIYPALDGPHDLEMAYWKAALRESTEYNQFTACVVMHDALEDSAVHVFFPQAAAKWFVRLGQKMLENYSTAEIRRAFDVEG